MSSYAGSPALAPEAREKVLQTFRHTLALAQEGKNEEALLGCDFLLKMDARFAPARGLLEMLRGVAPGTPVNVDQFSEYLGVESAGEALSESAPELPVAFPTPVPPSAVLPSAVSATSLDDLVFGDDAGGSSSAGLPEAPASVIAARAFAPTAPGGDPFGLGLDDLRMSLPEGGPGALGTIPAPVSAPPLPAPAAAAPPAPGVPPAPGPTAAAATVAPPRAPSGVQTDPRITQFLKQGDEALARGNAQEAIDLWSRVFLIDLSNEEASRRIDSAREAQAESARKIDLLLSEGVQSYEAGDLAGARNKFLDVLAASENDATARGYLNQIEAALATAGGSSEPLSASAGDSDFMKNEIEAPGPPSFAEDSGVKRGSHPDAEGFAPDAEGAERPPEAASRKTRVDLRLLLVGAVVVLAAVAGGTYLFLKNRAPARPANAAATPAKGGGPGGSAAPLEDTFQKAEALFGAGKIDDAIGVLAKLPESDPRHNEALVRIEKMKSSAAPTPGPAPPSGAALDEMRVAGFAAMASSRYIDALKNLDPVVKARPQDAEAATAAQKAHEQVETLRSAAKSYNEFDYDSAIKLLWELRRGDAKNQDVEEYLVNAYYNLAVQSFQAGNIPKATTAVKEATDLRPGDAEAQRLLRFGRKYPKGATDLLSRILIKHLTLRP
jgi:tetratricopeptide (TPR) repeat protein